MRASLAGHSKSHRASSPLSPRLLVRGRLLLPLVVLCSALGVLVPAPPARAAVLTVANTSDPIAFPTECPGPTSGSLREMMFFANECHNGGEIRFAIPGEGPHTITIGSALPRVEAPLQIDATSQPGYAGTPVVQLVDGANLATGIAIRQPDKDAPSVAGAALRGMSIGGFGTSTGGGAAVHVSGLDVTLSGNWLGVGPDGKATPNTRGVFIDATPGSGGDPAASARITVGGPTAAERNVISGNSRHGIYASGQSSAHRFEGNYIGTTPDGRSGMGNGGAGIYFNGSPPGVTIKNNVVSGNGFTQTNDGGLNIRGPGHVITGNRIGTDASGTVAIPNKGAGISHIGADGGANVRIGGPTPAERNIISGNTADGIDWALNPASDPAKPHVIEGNYIGADASGSFAIPNGESGIELSQRRNVRVVGNLVSSNGAHGIDLQSVGVLPSSAPTTAGTGGVVVQRNYVGTDASGTAPMGNTLLGIHLHGVFDALVGGNEGEGNIVSANGRDGVRIAKPNGSDGGHRNLVKGNRVGAPVGGPAELGNLYGVTVHNGATDNVIEGNVISRNANDGVAIGLELSNSTDVNSNRRNDIRRNVITENGKLGIDLLNNGEVLPNDNGDGDIGANLRQNYPVLTDVSLSGATTTVTGTLNSVASKEYRIDVYANTECDASGHGEGRRHLGSFPVTTDASGNTSFGQPFTTVPGIGVITATATDATGNTSEFSACMGSTVHNTSPEAVDDAITVARNSDPVPVDVLANDSDADGDTLGVIAVGAARHGTTALSEDGVVTYQPDPGFSGADGFTYTISDPREGTATGSVSVTVETVAVNLPPVITSNGGEDTATVPVAENTTEVTTVVASDPEGQRVTYSLFGGDDADKFNIDPQTGVLEFISAPDFENPTAANGDNVYIVAVRAEDASMLFDTQILAVVVTDVDEVAPVTVASTTPSPNAAGWNNSDVTVTLNATDEGGSGVKEIVYEASGATLVGPTSVAGSSATVTISAEGSTTLRYFARDNAGNTEQEQTLVIRIDKTAPSIECVVTPDGLWPPNHKLVDVTLSISVADGVSGPGGFALTSASSSEPDNGLGDGDTHGDIQGFDIGTPDTSGQLRAERSGGGRGRTYSLVYSGADQAGNAGTCTVSVHVPHDQRR